MDKLLSELEGKSIEEVISAGVSKLASVPAGGGGGGGAASGGGGGGAAGQSCILYLRRVCVLREMVFVQYAGYSTLCMNTQEVQMGSTLSQSSGCALATHSTLPRFCLSWCAAVAAHSRAVVRHAAMVLSAVTYSDCALSLLQVVLRLRRRRKRRMSQRRSPMR